LARQTHSRVAKTGVFNRDVPENKPHDGVRGTFCTTFVVWLLI